MRIMPSTCGAVGIDLGMTFSRIACVNEEGIPTIIPVEGGTAMPSVVMYNEDGTVTVGEQALRQALVKSHRVVQWIRRSIGEEFTRFIPKSDADAKPRTGEDGQVVAPEGTGYTPEEVSAEILRKLVQEAQSHLGRPVRKAIITCPAWFTDKPRKATEKAGELAGLEVLRIVNEPTAAAVYYGLDKLEDGEIVVVYDLGGGTFDCSVIEYRSGELKHLASDGNRELGGHDWTSTLMERVAEKMEDQFGRNPLHDPLAKKQLYENCERAKRAFNDVDCQQIACTYQEQATAVEVTRQEFEQWTEPHVAATLDYTEKVVQKAKKSWSDVNHLLLVGGSTRLRRVAEALEQLTGKQPIKTGMEDTMVALGAAALTAKEVKVGHGRRAKLRPVQIRETTPHALGVLVNAPPGSGMLVTNRVVAEEGIEIPFQRSRNDFKTNNPEFFDVPVLQGADPNPKRCEIICTYRFQCLPGTITGSTMQIALAYNANNQIFVEAVDVKHGMKLVGERIASPMKPMLLDQKDSCKSSYLDEDVRFSVFYPKAIPPQVWCDLVASAHLEEKRPNARDEIASPFEKARAKASAILKDLPAEQIREVTQDSDLAIPQGGQITFVPRMDHVQFNPSQQSFHWEEDEHTFSFRLRADAVLDGKVVRGRMTVFLGAILVADIPLRFKVGRLVAEMHKMKQEIGTVRAYRKIFASYSHRDLAIVEQFERYAEAIGDEYLRDWRHLRSGDRWNDKLLQMIDAADVFQLFWSRNAMESEYVRREWQHALKRNREGFIRPVYWEEPFPQRPPTLPPPELAELHFQRIGGGYEQYVPNIVPAEPRESKPNMDIQRSAGIYCAKISRIDPICLLFLVDQSESMRLPCGGEQTVRKADAVADAINRLLYGFVQRSTTGNTVLDRYYIGLFGYGNRVGSALGGELAEQGLVPFSAIANKPLRLETRLKKLPDGAGGMIEVESRFPIWLEPVADGPTTPMCEALRKAKKAIESFISSCPTAFPPIVINITGAAATDGDPELLAAELRGLATKDGNVLLFNVHISSKEIPPVELPVSDEGLPDKQARLLYRMSSLLPQRMIAEARSLEQNVPDGARGFVFNADLISVIEFLDIGTRTGSQ